MFGFTKWPSFQFLINPSTLFIISGMLVAKYKDDPVVETGHAPPVGLMNSSLPISLTQTLEERVGKSVANNTLLEPYHLLDPVSVLEMRLISLIIQGHENSTQWQFKFVDLPSSASIQTYLPLNYYTPHPPRHFIERKANVLITDPQERIPIWVVVNLNTMKVERWARGKQGGSGKLTEEEIVVAGEIAMSNVEVQQRVLASGYEHIEDVVPDIWDAGFVSGNPKEKLVQVYFYGVQKREGEETHAFPFNFVAYVGLGKNVVHEIDNLPLHLNSKTITAETSPITNVVSLPSGALLPPNAIRSELYRLKRSYTQTRFQISGTEELQR